MKRKHAWFFLLLVTLVPAVLSSCGGGGNTPTTTSSTTPPTGTTAPPISTTAVAQGPQYGGTFIGALSQDFLTFDILSDHGAGASRDLTNERLQDGDWTKGPAGGYGSSATMWDAVMNLPALKQGRLAESLTWAADPDGKTVTTTIKVRQGIHYALNSNSEASRLVAGREVTTDDVIYNLNARMNDPRALTYKLTPLIRGLKATKVDPRTVTITVPLEEHLNVITRMIDSGLIFPPEVMDKYGDMSNWKVSVGTGPFMLTDYVSGSTATLIKNQNYWMTDPIGPGKGNQLPYVDKVKWQIIPDASTRLAALRTAKVDWQADLSPDEASEIRKTAQGIKEAKGQTWAVQMVFMRTDKAPFSDVRVRRAMMMATNFNEINQSFYDGIGEIQSWPYWTQKGYEGLYLGLDDPECPQSVKDLYSYNPDKAKQLLKDAGLPTGFKATVLLTVNEVDYYSVVKEMWAKVNIDLTLDVKDNAVLNNIRNQQAYQELVVYLTSPPATYPQQSQYYRAGVVNASFINDPLINEAAIKAAKLAITDMTGAMKITKEMMKYLLDQAYAIPTPRYPGYMFWWPWVKNYDGEENIGYQATHSWLRWLWIDESLKKSMGH